MDKKYLIEKWLKDELTDAEKQAFNQLDDALLNKYIIDFAQHFKSSHFSKTNDFNTFKANYKAREKPVKKLIGFNPLLKIASIIIVGLGIYFTFFFNTLTHVKTLASEKTTIELPDQSRVELNALSSIEYDTKKWNNNRTLKLDGEAYFKVSKGNTFNVTTNLGIVTVIGTQFNVKQREDYFEVKCFEGVVKVTCGDMTRQLLAGDTFQILKGKLSERKTVETSPKWINNMSAFEAMPFKEVLAELERQYNIEVTYEAIDVNRIFTGGFTHNNLEDALIAITQPMNLTYVINSPNLVVIHE